MILKKICSQYNLNIQITMYYIFITTIKLFWSIPSRLRINVTFSCENMLCINYLFYLSLNLFCVQATAINNFHFSIIPEAFNFCQFQFFISMGKNLNCSHWLRSLKLFLYFIDFNLRFMFALLYVIFDVVGMIVHFHLGNEWEMHF